MVRANADQVKTALRGLALLSALSVAVAEAYLINYHRYMAPMTTPSSVASTTEQGTRCNADTQGVLRSSIR